MAAATESPPKGAFQFSDDQEYPPLTQSSDWDQPFWIFEIDLLALTHKERMQLTCMSVILINLVVCLIEDFISSIFGFPS